MGSQDDGLTDYYAHSALPGTRLRREVGGSLPSWIVVVAHLVLLVFLPINKIEEEMYSFCLLKGIILLFDTDITTLIIHSSSRSLQMKGSGFSFDLVK